MLANSRTLARLSRGGDIGVPDIELQRPGW